MRPKPRSGDRGSSVVERLPMPNPTASLTALRAYLQTSWSTSHVQHPILNPSMRLPKIPNATGQPSSLFSTRLLPVNNSHPPYHNHWQIPLLLSFIKRLSPSKSRSLSNYSVVTPHLLILISHTVTSCSRISCLSAQLRFQNYSSQCLTNHRNLTTSKPRYWSHVRTFSSSSFHILQTWVGPVVYSWEIFFKLKLGMMQFRAIKISTEKDLSWISLAREKYTCSWRENNFIDGER